MVDPAPHPYVAGAVHTKHDLLEHQARQRAGAKGCHLDRRPDAAAVEVEARSELSAGEVVRLLLENCHRRDVGEEKVVDREVARERVGHASERLDPGSRIDSGEPVQDGEPVEWRNTSGPKAHDAVRQVRREIPGEVLANGRRADRRDRQLLALPHTAAGGRGDAGCSMTDCGETRIRFFDRLHGILRCSPDLIARSASPSTALGKPGARPARPPVASPSTRRQARRESSSPPVRPGRARLDHRSRPLSAAGRGSQSLRLVAG